MKFLNKNNPWRPVYIACSLFLGIGYLLYFLAYFLPTPQWGRAMMTWAMPSVRALNSAARVGIANGSDPFPAQVVILYCAVGSIFLIGICVCMVYLNKQKRQKIISHLEKKITQSKHEAFELKLFFSGLVLVSLWVFFPLILFIHKNSELSQQAKRMFASSSMSSFFLLMSSLGGVLGLVLGMFYITISISYYFSLIKK